MSGWAPEKFDPLAKASRVLYALSSIRSSHVGIRYVYAYSEGNSISCD